MSEIKVLSRTQKIIVESNKAVSVVNAGPIGPGGPRGIQGEVGPQGERGIQGDPSFIPGPQGIQGEAGPQGDIGPQGIQGVPGVKGDKGDRGDVGPVGAIGPQGVQGDIGPQGIQGPIGPQGDVGPQGIQGVKGDQGDQGIQGVQGAIGPQGPQGIAGVIAATAPVLYDAGTQTVSLDVGQGAAQVPLGNDPRFTNSRPPNGAASGVLAGTYPSPDFAPSPLFSPSAVGTVGLRVKALASQTADLFQTQNSSGGVNSGITPAGRGYFASPIVFGGAALSVGAANTANPVAVFRAGTGQSGNVQEWQDVNGAVTLAISPSGGSLLKGASALLTVALDTNGWGIRTGGDANKGLVIRRNSATQSANLFEVQDESGVFKLAIAPSGRLGVGAGFLTDSGGGIAGFSLGAPSTTAVPFLIKLQPSMVANAFEIMSSATALLAFVTSAGSIRAVGAMQAVASVDVTDSLYSIAYTRMGSENSGGYVRTTKQTAKAAVPAANQIKTYVRDGTNAGTLKLVALGPGNVETTILDNIA